MAHVPTQVDPVDLFRELFRQTNPHSVLKGNGRAAHRSRLTTGLGSGAATRNPFGIGRNLRNTQPSPYRCPVLNSAKHGAPIGFKRSSPNSFRTRARRSDPMEKSGALHS